MRTKKRKNLEVYAGNLVIKRDDVRKYSKLVYVTEDLIIYSDVRLRSLKGVGGNLYIVAGVRLEVPKLGSVGEDLHMGFDAMLDAPKLGSVGEDLHVGFGAKMDAPKLGNVGEDLYLQSAATLVAPKLKGWSNK